jgi:3-oxoacyl-[acyl-carrier protein] reductase
LQKVIDIVGPQVEEQGKAEVTAEKRLGQPEDIAFIVGFLASEEGRWINGSSVSAHGGMKSLLTLQG